MGKHAQHLLAEPANIAAGVLTQLYAPDIGSVLQPAVLLVELIGGVQLALKCGARDFAARQFGELVECECRAIREPTSDRSEE
jgi:hypothetical protein